MRFSVITLPSTAIGRYIGQQPFLEGYLESLWSNTLSRLSTIFENENACQNDYIDFDNFLSKITVGNSTNQQRLLNLSIGEVLIKKVINSYNSLNFRLCYNLKRKVH